MKFAKLIAVPAATIALSLGTVTTFTGCEDVLGTTDTVSIEKLGVPFVEEVTVLSDASADIVVSGSFQKKEKFAGFAVLSSPAVGDTTDSANVIATWFVNPDDSSEVDSWTDTAEIMVDIDDIDADQTWWISAFNDDLEMGQSVPATFYGRVLADDQELKEYMLETVVENFTGLDVDNMVEVKVIEADIETGSPVAYATNRGADVIVEKKSGVDSLLITPIGGAVIFEVAEETQFTEAQIKKLYDDSYDAADRFADVEVDSKTYTVYSQGKSVRDADDKTLALVDQNFYVITSAYDVARIVVKSTDAAATATLSVYKASGMNSGLQLRAAN